MSETARRRGLMGLIHKSPYEHGTWEDLFWHVDHKSYAEAYAVGEVFPLDLGSEGTVNAKILGFDKEDKSDNSGKAAVTFSSAYLLKTKHRFNPALSPSEAPYEYGTGTVGGWGQSELRSWMRESIKPLIPEMIRARIAEVKKVTKGALTSGSMNVWLPSDDDVWVPSAKKIYNTQDGNADTPTYRGIIGTQQRLPGGNSNQEWLSRTGMTNSTICTFNASGYTNSRAATNSYYTLLGFCID